MHEIIELPDFPKRKGGPQPVRIADHVWIGAGAIVLKGVSVGENAIIAAGAIVTHDVPPETLVAGAPARVIRRVADGGERSPTSNSERTAPSEFSQNAETVEIGRDLGR